MKEANTSTPTPNRRNIPLPSKFPGVSVNTTLKTFAHDKTHSLKFLREFLEAQNLADKIIERGSAAEDVGKVEYRLICLLCDGTNSKLRWHPGSQYRRVEKKWGS